MNLERFGQTLHQSRKQTKLTQAELAEKIGVSKELISNWERAYKLRGRRWVPDRTSVINLIKIFKDVLYAEDAYKWALCANHKLTFEELYRIYANIQLNDSLNLIEFGKTLQALRQKKDLTQQELALEINVSSNLISKWETAYEANGRQWKPSRNNVIDLINVFTSELTMTEAQLLAKQAGFILEDEDLAHLIPDEEFLVNI